jgi:putative transcriptional regulator
MENREPMIRITLNEALKKKGKTVYWLAQNSTVPHVTLWKLSKATTQKTINLSVMSNICAALGCEPGDLLEFIPDAKDAAIAAVVKASGGITKKGSAK